MRSLTEDRSLTRTTDWASDQPRTSRTAHSNVATWCSAAAFAIMIATLVARFAVYLDFVVWSIRYPFELDYGEGIIWQQALLIPGARMYGDIRHFPFIVFHYPPVYHLAVRAIAAFGLDYLKAGRGLSAFSALSMIVLIAVLTFSAVKERVSRTASLIGASIAGLITCTYEPFATWSLLMRVDMFAIALSFLGIFCAIRARTRPCLLYVSLFVFVLAVYTKQTSVAAPLATLPILLLTMPRQTIKAIYFGLALGFAILLLLTWQTDGGFIRHAFLYNINRYSATAAITAIWGLHSYSIYLLMAIASVITGQRWLRDKIRSGGRTPFRQFVAQSTSAQLLLIFTLYFAISTCMLATLGKSGGNTNYFIEWMCVWSVLIGILVASSAEPILAAITNRPNTSPTIWNALVPLILALQVSLVPWSQSGGLGDAVDLRQQEQIVRMVREATKPVASDDMVLLMKAGMEVPWEGAILTELASMGRWDEQPLLEMIKSHMYAFIITIGHSGDSQYDNRHTPAVTDAISAAYPRTEQIGIRLLHLPPS
jgi:hypothetical protein